jgi:hypothetical protein
VATYTPKGIVISTKTTLAWDYKKLGIRLKGLDGRWDRYAHQIEARSFQSYGLGFLSIAMDRGKWLVVDVPAGAKGVFMMHDVVDSLVDRLPL